MAYPPSGDTMLRCHSHSWCWYVRLLSAAIFCTWARQGKSHHFLLGEVGNRSETFLCPGRADSLLSWTWIFVQKWGVGGLGRTQRFPQLFSFVSTCWFCDSWWFRLRLQGASQRPEIEVFVVLWFYFLSFSVFRLLRFSIFRLLLPIIAILIFFPIPIAHRMLKIVSLKVFSIQSSSQLRGQP